MLHAAVPPVPLVLLSLVDGHGQDLLFLVETVGVPHTTSHKPLGPVGSLCPACVSAWESATQRAEEDNRYQDGGE